MSRPDPREPSSTGGGPTAVARPSTAVACRSTAIACRLTAPGRSAVAVIGVAGDLAADAVNAGFRPRGSRPLSAPPHEDGDPDGKTSVRYGFWHGENGSLGGSDADLARREDAAARQEGEQAFESVVVTPLDEGRFEIHCHGGEAAVARILEDLRRQGVETVDPERWVEQTDPRPWVIREAWDVLARCQTARLAAIATDQARGALVDWATAEKTRLLSADDAEQAIGGLRDRCRSLIRRARIGLHLARPFRVVLAGPPNVGKSSLINAIVGFERSITFDQAGTTRDVLRVDTVADGLPIELSDTAGLRSGRDTIEREGVRRARRAIRAADLVVWVTEPEAWEKGGENWGRSVDPRTGPTARQPLRRERFVVNQADRRPGRSGEFAENPHGPSDRQTRPGDRHTWRGHPGTRPGDRGTLTRPLWVSALDGTGMEAFLRMIVDSLVPEFPPPGSAVPVTPRQCHRLIEIARSRSSSEALEALERLTG